MENNHVARIKFRVQCTFVGVLDLIFEIGEKVLEGVGH
jgi:hypothetical protein